MNENHDLTKILKGCSKRTKLYSPFIGDVNFDSIVGRFICVTTVIEKKFNTSIRPVLVEELQFTI